MKMLNQKSVRRQTVCAGTPKNIARQDFVDNKVFELVNELLPQRKQINWDIKVIGDVRDAIFSAVSEKVCGLNERKFYSKCPDEGLSARQSND